MPKSLCIHVNRVMYSYSSSSKIQCNVDFRLQMTIRTSQTQVSSYNLVAIIEHIGYSAETGHYICYRKLPNTTHWLKTSDEYVQIVKETDALKAEPFILFYEMDE